MRLSLAFGVDEADHLVAVPSGTRRELTTLGFRPEGMTVSTRLCAPVTLDWELYGRVANVMDGPSRPDGWAVVPWTDGRAGPLGVAVQVSGRLEDMTAALYSATSSVWRRFNAAMGSSLIGHSLPVLPNNTAFDPAFKEFSLLAALCAVLHDMPNLRPRLGDSGRVQRLARDLEAQRLKRSAAGSGVSGDAVDIHFALVKLGYTHRYTRPLAPCSSTVAEVTDQVLAALSTNPYRTGRAIDREHVERIVRRDFVDVEPWPFGALVET